MSEQKEGVSLKKLVGGIINSLSEAKYLGDLESLRLAESYKKEKGLSHFSVPAFSISDTEIELRFSIAESPREKEVIQDIKVNILPDSLKGLEPHHVSLLKLKISPVNVRNFEEI